MIEVTIDLSGHLGTARDQASRGMCLGFAASDCNRFSNSANQPLSVDYLAHHAVKNIPGWKAGDGLSVGAVAHALTKPGQPDESNYPYDSMDHSRPLQVVPTVVGKLHCSAMKKRQLTTDQVIEEIQSGQPVCLITAVTDTFYMPQGGVITYSTQYYPNVLHAVIGIGLGKHIVTGEEYVFIRNSWGIKWGVAGHAWLPLSYLQIHLFDSFTC